MLKTAEEKELAYVGIIDELVTKEACDYRLTKTAEILKVAVSVDYIKNIIKKNLSGIERNTKKVIAEAYTGRQTSKTLTKMYDLQKKLEGKNAKLNNLWHSSVKRSQFGNIIDKKFENMPEYIHKKQNQIYKLIDKVENKINRLEKN